MRLGRILGYNICFNDIFGLVIILIVRHDSLEFPYLDRLALSPLNGKIAFFI